MKPNLISQWGWLMKIYNTDESEMIGGLIYADSTLDQLKQAIEKAPDFWKENLQANDAPSQSMFLDFMSSASSRIPLKIGRLCSGLSTKGAIVMSP